MFHRLMRALVPSGVLYASWKYGETERTEASSGRLFCDMTEQRAEALAQAEGGASIEACWISEDVRADRRSQKWLNVIFLCRKIQDDTKRDRYGARERREGGAVPATGTL
ncbi:hypothetical protein [Oribacterium sp. Sow4_G1_1]|uniref:hypothetical protein n=1 Tax=Oribacterium sp. Sow4_G1_1 TaxID=3438794 RepID=UPI003F97497C